MAESELRPIPPNKLTHFANALRKGREFLDQGGITFKPTDSRMGFGELLVGEAPEVLEEWSYGFKPWTGKGQTTTLDPRLIDVAGLPTFGVLTAANVLRKGARKAGRTAIDVIREGEQEMADPSRRDFLKKMGAVGVAGASASVLPDMLRKAGIKEAARLAPKVTTTTLKSHFSKLVAEQLKRQLDFWEKQNVLGQKVADMYGENPIGNPRMRELFMKDAERAQLHIMDDPKIDEMYGRFMGALPDDVDPLEAYKRIMEVQNDPDIIGMRAWTAADTPMPELVKHDYHSAMAKIKNGEITPEELDHWILEGALPKKMTADEAYALELDDIILDTKAFKELPSDMLDANWYLMMQEVY